MIQKLVFTLVLGITSLLATNLEVQINECKSGNVQSCYAAATALTTGKNAENQEKKTLGLDLMRKACKFGEEKACDALGENYYIDKHYQAAKPYLINSCNKGVMTACEAMGTMYRDAQETKQDDVLSREFYEKACTLGSKDACINVGIMYKGGFGVEKNRAMEKSFYKKSCELKSKAGCDMFQKMDNKDKGIEEPGIWDTLKSLFN